MKIIYGRLLAGVIGKIIESHGSYTTLTIGGLDVSFEAQVGRELCGFLRDCHVGRDFFRTARSQEQKAPGFDGSSWHRNSRGWASAAS